MCKAQRFTTRNQQGKTVFSPYVTHPDAILVAEDGQPIEFDLSVEFFDDSGKRVVETCHTGKIEGNRIRFANGNSCEISRLFCNQHGLLKPFAR